ncbi:hypothetical protein [Tenacibaculum insulae]|uniref:hypothetical protein n=1 Tax=Tenacibaculum insulae TaxID=2029677 RepID=UPI003AB56DC8
MKKIITTTLLVLSIIVTANAQSKEVLARTYFLKAQEAYGNGENTNTVKQLDKTIEYLGATNAKIEALYVKIALNEKNYLDADKHFSNYFKEANENHSDYNDIITLYVDFKEEKAAISKRKDDNENAEIFNFTTVETPPVFSGCTGTNRELKLCFSKKIRKYFMTNFNDKNVSNMPSGKVKVYFKFNVGLYGNSSFQGLRIKDELNKTVTNPSMKKEIIRLIKSLPKMKPAMHNGSNVVLKYTMPLSFNF